MDQSVASNPRRGDAVEAWLKRRRDEYAPDIQAWHAINNLLDEWREKSDYGLALDEAGGDP
jgi:hypothetical protein